jgi:hypothetical protein
MAIPQIRSTNSLFHRFAAFRERHGTKGAAYMVFDMLLQKTLRTSVNTVVWLDLESLTEMAPPDPQFSFRFLSADEIAAYSKDPIYHLDEALANRARGGRDLCFAALAGDRLAAFGWYALESIEPEHAGGVAISYPSDTAFMYFGFTHPDFRGARLHGLAMGLALRELSNRGITKLVSLVAWTNWASLKSCYRLGYVNLGNVIAVGGQNRAFGVYPKAAKRLGVRFGRKAAKRKASV